MPRVGSIRFRFLLTVFLPATISSSLMAQPSELSSEIAECGGLMRVLADLADDAVEVRQFEELATALANAGIQQARQEGHFYPEFFIESTISASVENWARAAARSSGAEVTERKMRDCAELTETIVLRQGSVESALVSD